MRWRIGFAAAVRLFYNEPGGQDERFVVSAIFRP
jgi:hypothetical protein